MMRKTYEKCSDEELMRRLARGEEGAFSELYRRYQEVFFGFFYRMLYQDQALAEDKLQELFIGIMHGASDFDPSRNFRPWAFSIAYNLCRKEYRRRSREPALEQLQGCRSGFEPDWEHLDQAVRDDWLERAVNALPKEQRECLLLRYQQGMSVREISEITGSVEGTVKSRLHYALKRLSEKWNAWKAV